MNVVTDEQVRDYIVRIEARCQIEFDLSLSDASLLHEDAVARLVRDEWDAFMHRVGIHARRSVDEVRLTRRSPDAVLPD